MRKGRSDDVRCVVVDLWKVSHVSPQFLKKYLGDPRPRSPARGHQSLMGEICWRRANSRCRMVSPCRKLDEGCRWSVWSLCDPLCTCWQICSWNYSPGHGLKVFVGNVIASIHDPLRIFCILLYHRLIVCHDFNSIKLVRRGREATYPTLWHDLHWIYIGGFGFYQQIMEFEWFTDENGGIYQPNSKTPDVIR